ncbi:MAG: YraN family protein [Planctomycetes bacterium]|nr:YraN family protein [Planctomycetota bacterium]
MWPFGPGGRKSDPSALGRRGERLAMKFLKSLGLKILVRNYSCRAGEIDIIALDESTKKSMGWPTIVFVEVKTRKSDLVVGPESAVDSRKRRKIEKVAAHYLSSRDADEYAWRFDVIAVVIPPDGGKPQITHLSDAF